MRKVLVIVSILLLIPLSLVVAQTPLISFPSGHPEDSVSGTFISWGDDIFDIYIWRESGYVWVEIIPISGNPYICPSVLGLTFFIIQDDIRYNNVKFEDSFGDNQCGDVSIPSVFRLTYWSVGDAEGYDPADFSQAFTLVYDGAENVYYTLDMPASDQDSNNSNNNNNDTAAGSGGGSGGGCFLSSF